MAKTLTRSEFIRKSRELHGNAYTYARLEYTNATAKVTITCKKHGDFVQRAGSHLDGCGCPECAEIRRVEKLKSPRLTLEEFLTRAEATHGSYFDYSKVKWAGFGRKVLIICPKHGAFEQTPAAHCKGAGCVRCSGVMAHANRRTSLAEVKARLKNLHPNLIFKHVHNVLCENIEIECKSHGMFTRSLRLALAGKGCAACRMEEFYADRTYSTEKFIEKATLKYGNYYDYSKTKYIDCSTPVIIGCPVHGEFLMSGKLHLSNPGGRCCPGFRKDSRLTIGKRTFTVLSATEAHALRHIFKTTNIRPSQLKDRSFGGLPIIHGKFGKHKRYLPDFYVEKSNLVIEVKSPGSFGIARYGFMNAKPTELIKMMQQKALATEKAGYNFDVYVMDKSRRVELPEGWMYYTPTELWKLFN